MTQAASTLEQSNTEKVALVTGAAQRIGAEIARSLHAAGLSVIVHCNSSKAVADALVEELNASRANSACAVAANLEQPQAVQALAEAALAAYGRLDVLVNNASRFTRAPFAETDQALWQQAMGSNLQGPYFLTQALHAALQAQRGCVVNIIDIHARRPLPGYSAYCIAKAGLEAMTRSLALELAPAVRVNGVAPGAILWPEAPNDDFTEAEQHAIVQRVPLQTPGQPQDIAEAVTYLALRAPYVSGQVLAVDGGRSIAP